MPLAMDGIALAQPTHEFHIEARLVEIEQVAQQRGSPHAAERTVRFKQPHLRARPAPP